MSDLAEVSADGLAIIELAEDDERWPEVSAALASLVPDRVDMVSTKFTAAELDRAELLEMVPTWHHQYPQPDGDRGYLHETYDPAGRCDACGVGAEQRAPFRLARAPRWGTRTILQLNWVFGEYFVRPDVAAPWLSEFHIDTREVLRHRGGAVLESIRQLRVDAHVSIPDVSRLVARACDSCSRTKYEPHVRGPFPHVDWIEGAHLAKTSEWFGSGARAYQVVLVSAELMRRLRDSKVRGIDFKPVSSLG